MVNNGSVTVQEKNGHLVWTNYFDKESQSFAKRKRHIQVQYHDVRAETCENHLAGIGFLSKFSVFEQQSCSTLKSREENKPY